MPAKFSVLAVSAMPIFTLSLACGGNGDSGKGGGINVMPDAAPIPPSVDAPMQASCMIEQMLMPTFTAMDQFAETAGSGSSGSNAHTEVWGGRLNMDMTPDFVQVELYAGFAAFAGTDITAKAIPLTGDELNYKTCGACVRIFADVANQMAGAQYFATGGMLELTSVQGSLKGTLTNVTLEKVTIAQDYTSTPVGDGCNTKIVAAQMDAQLMMGSAAPGTVASAGPMVLRHRRH
jgi:hypothetical protein